MSNSKLNPPPAFTKWLQYLFSSPEKRGTILNDLEEGYWTIFEEKGVFWARMWYASQVLKISKGKLYNQIYWSMVMVKNYIKTTFRNLQRHKGYSFINIAGLAIGLACCILILLWVRYELSYDRFHEHGDNLYRIIRVSSTDPTASSVVIPLPLVPAIKEELPEVRAATRLIGYGRHLFRYGDHVFYESNGLVVDADFFSMFSFPLRQGSPSRVFSDPYSVVITQEMAEKYFGAEEAMGKVFIIDNNHRFTVTGVIERSSRSHLNFNYLLSFEFPRARGKDMDAWGDVSYLSYVHLHENSSLDELKEKMSAIIARHVPEYSGIRGFQPVKDIYYRYVRDSVISFSAIALIILVIACINFMNLSTARSGTRMKEISMRKVAGAHRTHLIYQFLGESFLMTFLALLLATALVVLSLPGFDLFSGENLTFDTLLNLDIILGFVGILIFTGLFSGLYPTLFFSKMHPISGLTDQRHRGLQRSPLRRMLVIIQFGLSIILIICTVVISQQIHFIKQKDLGFDEENLIYVDMKGDFNTNGRTIKHELLNHPNINAITILDRLPNMYGWGTDSPNWEGKQEGTRIQFTVRSVDPDYVKTFGITMAEGRFFSETHLTDDQAFVLNEEAAKVMGMDSPVGKWFEYEWTNKRGPIIGVVEDFHFASLHNEIEPLIMLMKPDQYRYMCFKVSSEGISETIRFIQKSWETYSPQFPFEYHFLDQALESLYTSERRSMSLVRIFSILAIFISCLGLLGMVSFILEHRTKEIGIRKVLGASVSGIIVHFTKAFVKWVAVANVFAWPIAYIVMNHWLQNYPYRTPIYWWIFALSGGLALVIALATILVQVVRAALANPVESLRYE